MSIVVTRSGDPPRVPLARIAKLVATLAPGLIRERTGKGLDVKDKGFIQYSKDYKDAKVAAGRNAGVNLTVTNGLLGSVAAVSVVVTEQGFTIVIAPGAGTSAAVQFVDGKAKRPAREAQRIVSWALSITTGEGACLPDRGWRCRPRTWNR